MNSSIRRSQRAGLFIGGKRVADIDLESVKFEESAEATTASFDQSVPLDVSCLAYATEVKLDGSKSVDFAAMFDDAFKRRDEAERLMLEACAGYVFSGEHGTATAEKSPSGWSVEWSREPERAWPVATRIEAIELAHRLATTGAAK